MSSTPHIDEFARLCKEGDLEKVKAYHKMYADQILKEHDILFPKSPKQDAEKEN